MNRLRLALLIVFLIAGCASTWDRSEKYREYVGKQFVTRYDCDLWKMDRHQYGVVAYVLEPAGSSVEPFGKKVAFIPVGSVVTVRSAVVRYSGGDWDYLIGELVLPQSKETVVFEKLLGFSSVDTKEVLKHLAPAK